MRQKLESKKLMMENMSIRSRLAKEDAGKQEEQLSGALQSLLVAGGTLSVTSRNLQVSLWYIIMNLISTIILDTHTNDVFATQINEYENTRVVMLFLFTKCCSFFHSGFSVVSRCFIFGK